MNSGGCTSQAQHTAPLSEATPELMLGDTLSDETLSIDMDMEEQGLAHHTIYSWYVFYTYSTFSLGCQSDDAHVACNQQVKRHCTSKFQSCSALPASALHTLYVYICVYM